MPTELTRRELYDLIWARPTVRVAADLGISDVALHKICERHRVPTPGRGYWAKVAAGKPVKKALFHEIREGRPDRIRIEESWHKSMPPAVLEARSRAMVEAKRVTKELSPTRSIDQGLHPIADRFKQKIDKASPGSDGFIRVSGHDLFPITITPAVAPRVLTILDLVARQADARGHDFASDGHALCLKVGDELIPLELTEKTDKVAHKPTEAELASLRRWEADRARKQLRAEWLSEWDKPRILEWDIVPDGRLGLTIDGADRGDGLRRTFADGARQRIETMLDHVFAAAAACATARRVRREDAERRKQRWQEEESRRREAERRRVLEEKRWEFLERQMKLHEEAGRIEAFVREYTSRHAVDDLPPSCRKLIHWAENRVRAIRAAIAPDQLAIVLDRYCLMDDMAEIGSWVTVR